MEISEKEWIELKGEIAICKHENAAMREIMKQEEKMNERKLLKNGTEEPQTKKARKNDGKTKK